MRILRFIASADPRDGSPIEGARQVTAIWAKRGLRAGHAALDAPGEQHLADYSTGRIIQVGPPPARGPLNR